MKTNQEITSFANIISEQEYEQFSESEKHDFLLDNNIYYKRNGSAISEEHIEYEDKKVRWFLQEYYFVNPIIIKEIVSIYLNVEPNYNDQKNRIKLEISNSLDMNSTLDYHYKKYNNVLLSSMIKYTVFYNEKGVLLKESIKKYLEDNIEHDLNYHYMSDYVCIKELDLKYVSLLQCVSAIRESMEMLDFLKRYSCGDRSNDRVKEGEKIFEIKELKTFFKNDAAKYIDSIYTKYKGLSNKKETAWLIHILEEEKVLKKTFIRVGFVRSIKGQQVDRKYMSQLNRDYVNIGYLKRQDRDNYNKMKKQIKSLISLG